MAYTVDELAAHVGGEVRGDGTRRIQRVAPLESAGADDLSLVANARYVRYLETSRAAAVLVPDALTSQVPDGEPAQIRVADVHAALATLLPLLYPEQPREQGIHPTAVVAMDAVVEDGVHIGAYAVVGERCTVRARARIEAHVVVGAGCTIGEDSVLHPHVTLYRGVRVGARCVVHSGVRLGSDGFGYVFMDGAHRKVPQVGGCHVGDDVEIGANSTIDRGSIGDTVIGDGTKIDNLVHLGHNVRVGRHAIIVAQVGVSGSTSIGDGAVVAGQAGIGGHLTIGARARVGAQAGVTADVAPGETVSGYPARPHGEALRTQANLFRLPELLRRVRRIEQSLGFLEGGTGRDDR
jgi:UDP-3-O-[3-hydroxymyristoyl] glucosamine N-acyltransferase